MDLESAAYTVDPSEVPPRPTILSNGIRMAAAYGHTGKWRLLDDFLGPRLVRVVIRCQRSDLDHRLAASPRTPNAVEIALTAYEEAMFRRSAEAANEGAAFYEMLAGENPAQRMLTMFTEHEQ